MSALAYEKLDHPPIHWRDLLPAKPHTGRGFPAHSWGTGPWEYEPDKVTWIDPLTGLECAIERCPDFGHLCGYVGVGPKHPWYGTDKQWIDGVWVHGGLTYSGERVGESGLWWLGFDCCHGLDYSPGVHALEAPIRRLLGLMGPTSLEVYRGMAYVIANVQELARQVAEA